MESLGSVESLRERVSSCRYFEVIRPEGRGEDGSKNSGGAAQGGSIKFLSCDADGLSLATLVRHLTDNPRHFKDIKIDYAILCLGRLRALRYECDRYNAATRPSDAQRFLEVLSSCGLKAGERPVQIHGLDELISVLEEEIPGIDEMRAEVELGRAQFLALHEVFKPGSKVCMQIEGLGEHLGLRVLQCWYQLQNTLFGAEKSFHVEFEFLASVGSSFALINYQEPFSAYKGVRGLNNLLYQALEPAMLERLKQRGAKYVEAAGNGPSYVQYERGAFFPHGKAKHALHSGGRVMLDTCRGYESGHHAARGGDYCSIALQQAMRTFALQKKHGTEGLRLVSEVQPEELFMAWPALVGFSFTSKCWGQVLVAETKPISFRAEAFDELVLSAERKELIRAAVRFDSQNAGFDLIEGKGDNAIFLLHGPPGSGKTLTAEAIAEMLNKPLYVVTAGDLGTTASAVEQKLSEVLHLCSEWNALTLIDEADIFLETRSTSELERNALVCVMLRLLEYHQGVLFLTTNRASNIDPAVRSRITVALRYGALSLEGREAVWARLLAKIPGSTTNAARLARHPLNGRQIKSCLMLATALAAERREDVSDMLIERAVEVVGESDLLLDTSV
eukprot:TRINITY_DN18438_c1_g3_i1.p1 TRINITY_DN18438_c1_g3~~TRINITY_DN18438_c1_g3_i1.p1  ORF type:complete len:627 (+),score=132.34 TRINITY_DN18438_c1_g3_i1:27-1883(+)